MPMIFLNNSLTILMILVYKIYLTCKGFGFGFGNTKNKNTKKRKGIFGDDDDFFGGGFANFDGFNNMESAFNDMGQGFSGQTVF